MSYKIAVQLTFTIDKKKRTLLLDAVEDTNVSTSSDITSHPLPNGNMISDHMYKNQASVTLRGVFSLNGSRTTLISDTDTSLASIEKLFERIKNEGILCEVVKITSDNGTNSMRFEKRDNMALTSVSWTERTNSLGFGFTFTQVLTSSGKAKASSGGSSSGSTSTKKQDDVHLPSTTTPITVNFSDIFIDTNKILKAMCALMTDKAFRLYIIKKTVEELIDLGLSKEQATLVKNTIVLDEAEAQLKNEYYASFLNVYESSSAKHQLEENRRFRLPLAKTKQKTVLKEYANTLIQLEKDIRNFSIYMTCWKIATDVEQDIMAIIDNDAYTFRFRKNGGEYTVSVVNSNGDVVSTTKKVSTAITNFADATSQGKLFATSTKYVYLIKEKGTRTQVLSNYYILLTSFRPEDYLNVLSYDIIH